MPSTKAMKRPLGNAAGFTLAEVVVAVGILTLALGLVGSGIFQAVSTERYWREDVMATRELRHAGSWFAGDALRAVTSDLSDGAAPVNAVTLTWTDRSGIAHSARYSLSDGNLVRDLDGAQITLARRVQSVGFSLSGKVLTFNLIVAAELGSTDSMSLNTFLRMLK